MASNPKDFVFDAWTPMSFKRALGTRGQPGYSAAVAPTWTGEHQRRLTAYKVLQSYYDNAARLFLNKTDTDEIDSHREYGDAAVIVDTVTAALLGEDQQIFVEGADDFVEEPEAGDTNEPGAQAAFTLQEWLREWAWDHERLGMKMIETERNAVKLGDGVYTLGWSPEKGRVRVRVFDPGFYFPVLSDGNEDDFPERVHIAWEVLDDDNPAHLKIRRITWELVDVEPYTVPYSDEPVTKTCLMSDGTFMLEVGKEHTIDSLNPDRATYETWTDENGDVQEWRDLDLGIDFMPVLHVPNTVALAAHYGRSTLATILQILDDLSNADTDLQAASATTGKPPIAVSGVTPLNPTYRPGEVWGVGDGSATIIDTSRSLDALLKYVDHLLGRLSINGRVPDSVLGRITGDMSSGIELRLRFGPLEAMVREMRLVRDEKYPLLLKFAWRIAVANGQEDVPTEWTPAKVEFGRFLPSDQAAAVEVVTKLLQTKAVSLETAITILVAAGFDITDAAEEVTRIQSRDFDGAARMLDATGDEQAVRDYLGLEGPPPEPPAPAPGPAAGLPPVQPPPEIPLDEGFTPPGPPQPETGAVQ